MWIKKNKTQIPTIGYTHTHNLRYILSSRLRLRLPVNTADKTQDDYILNNWRVEVCWLDLIT